MRIEPYKRLKRLEITPLARQRAVAQLPKLPEIKAKADRKGFLKVSMAFSCLSGLEGLENARWKGYSDHIQAILQAIYAIYDHMACFKRTHFACLGAPSRASLEADPPTARAVERSLKAGFRASRASWQVKPTRAAPEAAPKAVAVRKAWIDMPRASVNRVRTLWRAVLGSISNSLLQRSYGAPR